MTIDFPERSLEPDERSTCSECGSKFWSNPLTPYLPKEYEDDESETEPLCSTCSSYNG